MCGLSISYESIYNLVNIRPVGALAPLMKRPSAGNIQVTNMHMIIQIGQSYKQAIVGARVHCAKLGQIL